MKISNRYINKTIFQHIALVVLILCAMQLFLILVGQLDDIGQGHYGVLQSFVYTCLQMPHYLYLFFPIACLLGALLGLGTLASQSELIVLRCAGMSSWQIIATVLKGALTLIMCITLFGELLLPKINNYAENYKIIQRSGGNALRTPHGIWLRDNQSIIHINQIKNGHKLEGISEFKFNGQRQLISSLYANAAHYTDHHWELIDVNLSQFNENNIASTHTQNMAWSLSLKPKFIAVASIKTDEMTINNLYHYIVQQNQNHAQTAPYELAFWQRLLQPFANCIMLFLAVPFIFGPLRSATMGFRFLMGVTIGFSFYILNQLFGPMSLVYDFPPLLAAGLPMLLFASVGFLMMRRVP